MLNLGSKHLFLATPVLFILFISINQELILIHIFIHLYHIHVLTGIPFHLKLLMHLLIMFLNIIYRIVAPFRLLMFLSVSLLFIYGSTFILAILLTVYPMRKHKLL